MLASAFTVKVGKYGGLLDADKDPPQTVFKILIGFLKLNSITPEDEHIKYWNCNSLPTAFSGSRCFSQEQVFIVAGGRCRTHQLPLYTEPLA
jgi:hypothetical protein